MYLACEINVKNWTRGGIVISPRIPAFLSNV